MTKRTKLEETFNLPPIDLSKPVEDDDVESDENEYYSPEEMNQIMERADKINAALPQVSGLDSADRDYDDYAQKSIDAFEDLVDLGKNVEDKHVADIYNAASSMMGNALNAKSNKVQKKLEMVKLQIQKAKLEHENEKLEYLKARHLKSGSDDDAHETEGQIVTTRNDMLSDILAGMKKDSDG